MKADTLQILINNGINVPKFITIKSMDEYNCNIMDCLDGNKRYAVRSSFASEDSTSDSFAGQFDTVLSVSKNDIPDAIKRVLCSGSKSNVVDYASAKHLKTNVNGCVIIQEMVDADYSGVIFTANPLGILNETIIVVGNGLGNNVVEDKVDTTTYFYNQDDNLFYYEKNGESPILSNTAIEQIINVSAKIKKILGCDSDIEFAIKNDELFILQARPITTLSISNPIILDNSNIVESYPGVSLPLTQDFVKSVYHGIFYNLVKRMSNDECLVMSMDKYLVNMTDVANWRMYYRISNWYAVLQLLPFSKKIIPVWQNMLGVNNRCIVALDDIKVRFKTKIQVLRSFLHYMNKAPKYMDDLNKNFDIRFLKYSEQVNQADNISDLFQVYLRIKSEILSDWDITLINDLYTFIYTSLSGENNKQNIANFKNLESMKPAIALEKLIDVARQHGVDSDEYVFASNNYIAQYGDRCLGELKLETKTYRTNPELLDICVMSKAKQEATPISHSVYNDKIGVFAKRARIGIQNREKSRLNRSRIFGLSRTIFLKIGAIMEAKGNLDSARDVFYLHMNEIRINKDYRDLVQQRKHEQRIFESIPAYSRLVFSEKIVNKTNPVLGYQVFNDNSHLSGTPTSSGKVVGQVIVITNPNDHIDTTGKIIVTKSTDPGWVFLIKNAIGIIAEKGSLLSHTAIISRELNKPAIVNVKDCTTILKDDDVVELNTENGSIKILERGTICDTSA